MPRNDKYSYGDFSAQDLRTRAPSEFDDTEIIGSCFYQEYLAGGPQPPYDVFPPGLTNVTFRDCNLDNVRLPPTCTVAGGTNKIVMVQEDGEDWVYVARGLPPSRLREVL